MATINAKIERKHGIPMYDAITEKYWHFATRAGFTLPLVDRNDGIDPLERFQGVMARRCPAPTMLGALNGIFSSVQNLTTRYALPEPRRTRLHVLLGDPGVGKTELASVLREAMGWDLFSVPPGSGGGNLDELITETVFGSTSATSLIERINRALLTASEDSDLVKLLRSKSLIETLPREDGKGTYKRLDYTKLEDKIEDKIEQLKQVASIALPEFASTPSTISQRPGRLLQKLIEVQSTGKPTVILVDEFNRYKNFGSLMQNLYEVLAGTRSECTITGVDEQGNPKDYTFTYNGLQNVVLLGTGNIPDTKKEPEARALSDSLESRIGVKPIEMRFTAADYAHRLCQQHLGLALSTLYKANEAEYNANPAKAATYFSDLLTKGRTPAEQKQHSYIGTQQLLAKSGEFKEASELLGNVYYELQQLCAGKNKSLNAELKKGLESLPPFGPRQVQNPLAQWTFCLPDHPDFPSDEPPSQYNLGTRMTDALLYWIEMNLPKNKGLDNTRAYIGNLLVDNRIISVEEAERRFSLGQSQLQTNEPAGKKVAQLINVGVTLGREEELKAAQALLYEIAIRKFPDHKGAEPDELFPLDAIAGMLEEYELAAATERETISKDITLVPELEKEEGTGKFVLRVGHSETRQGNDKLSDNMKRMSIEQQLMAVIVDKAEDLSHLFIPKLISGNVQKEMDEKIKGFEQSRDTLIATARENKYATTEAIDADVTRIKSECDERSDNLREKYKEHLLSISAGTHPAGIGITTLVLAVKAGDKNLAGFTLLCDIPPPKPGEDTQLTKYVLVGQTALSKEVQDYLSKIHVTYINAATPDGVGILETRVSNLISIGAKRILEQIETDVEGNEEARNAQKSLALEGYITAWEAALLSSDTGKGGPGLFTLSAENSQKLRGNLLSAEVAESIQHAGTPDAKLAAMKAAGCGVGDIAMQECAAAPRHEQLVARLSAITRFVLRHGQFHEPNLVMPIAPQTKTVISR